MTRRVILSCSVGLLLAILNPGDQKDSEAQQVRDFLVSDSGRTPSVAGDLQGGFYVTWSNLNDAVHFAHFNPIGLRLATLDTFEGTNASFTPRLSAMGQYVAVVWTDEISDVISFFKSYIIVGIVPVGAANSVIYLMANSDPGANYSRGSPDIAFLNDTLMIAVWCGNGDSTPVVNTGIYGQLLTVSGGRIEDNFFVTDHFGNSIYNYSPRIISRPGTGNFTVVWEDNSSGWYELYGRKFDLTGTPLGSSFSISSDSSITYSFHYTIAQDTSGSFMLVWIANKGDKSQMEWRWYNKNAVAITSVQALTPLDTLFNSGSSISCSCDEENRAVIVWEQNTSQKYVSKIYGQRITADRTPLGSPFKISENSQSNETEIFPDVVITGGRIFTVWQTDTSGIEANILDFDSIATQVHSGDSQCNSSYSYRLYQNYPNPFNPSTRISYDLSKAAFVRLDVYNVLGQVVARFVERSQTAGDYEVQFDAENLPSGIYFYRLQAGTFTQTRKMIVLK